MSNPVTERITIGRTDLHVSPLGIGTMGWGFNNRADSSLITAFETTLRLGINLFDTAEIYTFHGSEKTLGLLMEETGQRPVITTKFFPMPWRLDKSRLLSALRGSLQRLRIAQVDLYLVHFPLPPVPIDAWMEALAEAVQTGLARAVGVSNFNPEQTARAHAALSKYGIPLAANQVEYSLLNRAPERSGLLSLCRELNVTVIAYSPVARGLLSGRYTPENPPPGWRGLYRRGYMDRIQPLVSLLRQIGEAHGGKTLSQVALNWTICKGTLPIPGSRTVEHIQEDTGALGWRLDDSEVAALDAAEEKI